MTLKIDGGNEKTGVEWLASDLTAYLADPQNAGIYSRNNEASYGRV